MKLIVAAALSVLPITAHADMSVDDLIGQLKTHAGGPTRGIHPMATPAAASAPIKPAVAGLVLKPNAAPAAAEVSMSSPVARLPQGRAAEQPQGEANLTVQFETGSDRLTPAAERTLASLGQALANPALAGDKFRIVGHTDSVGRADANQVLSERRAQAVVEYITSRYRVGRDRLTAIGMGQSQPLMPTPVGIAEPHNRRVQVINLGS